MNTVLSPAQVSLLHAYVLPDHSVSKHLTHSRSRFITLPLSATGLPFARVLDFAFRAQARQLRPAVSSLLSYGLVVHLLRLSTSSRDDAVAVSYRPESVCLERICTSLS